MKHNIFSIALLIVYMTLYSHGTAAVPDSLQYAYQKLEEISKEAKSLNYDITTPADLKRNSSKINILKKRMSNLEQRTPEIFDNKEMIKLYNLYNEYMLGIDDKVEQYKEYLLVDSLQNTLKQWLPRFDSLLSVGQQYVSRREVDSVRSVKRYSEDWWNKINALRESNKSYFESDEQLKKNYASIDKARCEIRELEEKERPKVREILMLVAVIIGVVTLVVSIVTSIIKSKKMSNDTYLKI